MLHDSSNNIPLMEESVNFTKGYNKVSPNDDETTVVHHQPPPSNRRRTTSTIIITLLLSAIIIATAIGATTVLHRTKPPQPHQSSSLKATELIKTICNVTQHPQSCFSDVSSVVSGDNSGESADPEVIFNITLRIAVNELNNISSLPKTLISNSNDLRTGSALRDCATLFDDAVSQLVRSVESMRAVAGDGDAVALTVAKVADLKTWISAAMTDLDTCVDGLEEMGSTAVDEVRVRVQRPSVCMSNSLAILDNMEGLLDRFGLRLH